jgi:amino acid transporter
MEGFEAPALSGGAPSLSGGAKLTTLDCIAQSLAVGPIFSAAAIGGALAGLSGGVGPFVVLLTTVGILAVGYVVSELAKRYSGSGAVYELIAHTAGKPAGVFGAACYYLALASLGTALPIIGGMTAHDFFNNHMSIDLRWWVWGLLILALIVAVNLIGVQLSVKTQLAIIGLSAIPFLILCIVIIAKGGSDGNTFSVFNPSHVAKGGSVFKGLLFAILMFVGFEMAAALGEETANPKKSIPQAVIATILIVMGFYLLTQYAGTIGSGGKDQLPFDFPTLATHYMNSKFSVLIELAILLDIIGIGIGMCAAVSRGLFTLSRDGLLPKFLAKVNPRSNPTVATYLFGVFGLIVLLISLSKYGTTVPLDAKGAPVGPPDVLNAFLILSTIGSMMFCVVYVLLCVGAAKLFAGKNPAGLLAVIVGVLTAGGGLLAQFISGTAPVGDALWGRHIAIALVVLVGAWLAYLVSTRRSQVDQAASFALQH